MLHNYNIKNTVYIVFFAIILSIFTHACSKQDNPSKTKRINPNVDERAREAADKGPTILDRFKDNQGTNFQFGTSNVLWRATLSSIDFMPLLAVDYAGGVIVTDWYGKNLDKNLDKTEEIKLTVKFKSSEISVTSIEIISHKKICENFKCSIIANNKSIDDALKNKIFALARKISIEDENRKSKKK